MFNVPPAVTATLAVFAVVHAVRELVLSPPADIEFLPLFAFIPARYDGTVLAYPGGLAADVWTFVTYSLIHGNLFHLGLNAVWLLPFGSAVARRFGTMRYLGFFAVTAAAGAATHLATHIGELTPMVGASAAISGYMAASIRFVFHRAGPLGLLRGRDPLAYRVPAIPLRAALRDFRVGSARRPSPGRRTWVDSLRGSSFFRSSIRSEWRRLAARMATRMLKQLRRSTRGLVCPHRLLRSPGLRAMIDGRKWRQYRTRAGRWIAPGRRAFRRRRSAEFGTWPHHVNGGCP